MSQIQSGRDLDRALLDKFKDSPEFRNLSVDERNRVLDTARARYGFPSRRLESDASAARDSVSRPGTLDNTFLGDPVGKGLSAMFGPTAVAARNQVGAGLSETVNVVVGENLGLTGEATRRDPETGMTPLEVSQRQATSITRENLGDIPSGLLDFAAFAGDPAFLLAGNAVAAIPAVQAIGRSVGGAVAAAPSAQRAVGTIARESVAGAVAEGGLEGIAELTRTGDVGSAAQRTVEAGAFGLVGTGVLSSAFEGLGALRRTLSPTQREAAARALRYSRAITREEQQKVLAEFVRIEAEAGRISQDALRQVNEERAAAGLEPFAGESATMEGTIDTSTITADQKEIAKQQAKSEKSYFNQSRSQLDTEGVRSKTPEEITRAQNEAYASQLKIEKKTAKRAEKSLRAEEKAVAAANLDRVTNMEAQRKAELESARAEQAIVSEAADRLVAPDNPLDPRTLDRKVAELAEYRAMNKALYGKDTVIESAGVDDYIPTRQTGPIEETMLEGMVRDTAAARSGRERFEQSEAIRRAPREPGDVAFLKAMQANPRNPLVKRPSGTPYQEVQPVSDPASNRVVADPRPDMQPAAGTGGMYFYSGVPIDRVWSEAVVPIAKLGFRGTQAVGKIGKGLVDAYSGPLTQRIQDIGTPTAKALAASLRNAATYAKKFDGEMSVGGGDELMQLASGWITGKSKKYRNASINLNSLDEVAPGVYGDKFTLAMEDDAYLAKLGERERELVGKGREFMKTASSIAEREGAIIRLPSGAKVKFKADPNGKKIIRRYSDEMFDEVSGNFRGIQSNEARGIEKVEDLTPTMQSVIDGIVRANAAKGHKVKPETVMVELGLREQNARVAHAAFEHARVVPYMPTAVRLGDGRLFYIMQPGVFNFARNVKHSFANRVSFIKAFGADFDAAAADSLAFKVMNESGGNIHTRQLVNDTITGASGAPIERPIIGSYMPGGARERGWARNYQAADQAVRGGMRSLAFVLNFLEPPSKLLPYAGSGRFFRGLKEIATNYDDLTFELERIEAYTRDIGNWIATPGREFSDRARMVGRVIERINIAANEFNEIVAGATGRALARDLKNGRATGADRYRLEMMRFEPDEINALIRGEASDELYNEVIRRTVGETQGSNLRPQERSRAASSRIYNALIAHDSYAQMTMNRYARSIGKAYQKGDAYFRNPSRQTFTEFADSLKFLGGMTASHAATGMVQLYALSFMFGGGFSGAKALWNKMQDDPAGFVAHGLFNTSIGGPLATMAYLGQSSNAGAFREGLMRAFMPSNYLNEGVMWMMGSDVYSGQNTLEASWTLMQRYAPLIRQMDPWDNLAIWNIGNPARATDVAIRSYYEFARENNMQAYGWNERSNKRFLRFMRLAVKQIESGDGDGAQYYMRQALEVEPTADNDSLAASLLARRILIKFPNTQEGYELREKFRKRYGEEVYDQLVKRDYMLEAWAEALRF